MTKDGRKKNGFCRFCWWICAILLLLAAIIVAVLIGSKFKNLEQKYINIVNIKFLFIYSQYGKGNARSSGSVRTIKSFKCVAIMTA